MNYLESTAHLHELIEHANEQLLAIFKANTGDANKILLRTNFGKELLLPMEEFSNTTVLTCLKEYETEAIVISDYVSTTEKGKPLHYLLYKAYHKLFNKGLVCYQLIDGDTKELLGMLEFSNLEDNIFYNIDAPDFEESSCNAVETKENTIKNPSIVFMIGHMNSERLLFDLNQLIFETVNNVQKHRGRTFTFYLQVSRYGGVVTNDFEAQLNDLKKDLDKYIHPLFGNCKFILDLDELNSATN